MDNRIPVTILTGFLGAGKTTLLNRLIKDHPEKKLAIIENEFGEIGIDSELVIGAADGIFELSNGCLCCSLSGDLIRVLNNLMNRPERIDHLIVETTGIADPGPIALSFLSDYTIQNEFRLNAIITLADAQHIEQQLENQEEACKQIAAADLVLLNKTDQADNYTQDTAKNLIRKLNPQADIRECIYGEVKGMDLLALNAFSKEGVSRTAFEENYDLKKQQRYAVASGTEPGATLFGNTPVKKLQHSDIRSYSFVFTEPLDPMRFKIWIGMALNIQVCPVYRSKGILNFRDIDKKIIFQAINNQYVTEAGGEWKDEERKSRIVFIGKNLPFELLQKGLNACTSDLPFDPREFYNSINL